MKWITSTDLKQWADTTDCREALPELIKRLIVATVSHKNIKKIRFPSGDSICLSGWDGVVDIDEKTYPIESGISLWELGASKDIKSKAESDYSKRLNNTGGYVSNESTFVFVTPRIWDGAENWLNDKKRLNHWKNIIVITAIELEEWLLVCPSVSLWLAERLNKAPLVGVQTVNSFWSKWSIGKDITLKSEILLGGREKEVLEIINATKQPLVCIIQSMSQEESLAFIVACILCNSDIDIIQNKCIIVDNEDTLNQLIEKYDGLIIIANVERKNHMYALKRGHSILYVSNIGETVNSDDIIVLPQIGRDAFIKSLETSGVTQEYASKLSKETARSITILRRKLECDLTEPKWAKAEFVRDLIPAILIGRWLDENENDKEVISRIAGEPYDLYAIKLQRWLNSDDSPLVKIGSKWRIISPYEAFLYATKHITFADFAHYSEVFSLVFNDIDPDAIAKKDSTSLQFWKEKREYSGWLKEGILQSTVLISIIGENTLLSIPQRGNIWIDNLVDNILKDSSIEWWLSYKRVIIQIAEASPKCFVNFIIKDLKKKQSIIKDLFIINENGDFLFGTSSNYTDILFALEGLAWKKEFLLPISLILTELSNIKNDSNLSNKPINSLKSIFSVWLPQTLANISERNIVLGTIVSRDQKQGFELCANLLDHLDHAIGHFAHKMRWRLFGQYRNDRILIADMNLAITNTVQLLIKCCDKSDKQICKMIELSSQLAISDTNRRLIFDYLEYNHNNYIGSITLSNKLRDVIYHHKSFPSAEWSMPESEIVKYEHLMKLVESKNITKKYLWMFKDSYFKTVEIDRFGSDYLKRNEKQIEVRGRALKEIHYIYGIKGIFEFANSATSPSTVGESYANISNNEDFEQILIAVKKEIIPVNFAKAFFAQLAHVNGFDSFIKQINNLKKQNPDYIYFPLASACASEDIWMYVEELPEDIQEKYWINANVWRYKDCNSAQYAIRKLNSVKRSIDSINIVYQFIKDIPSNLIIETIMVFLHNPNISIVEHIKYELAKIIYHLDKRSDVDINDIIQIEMIFYELLRYHGDISELKLVNEILTNPESMMDLIKMAYMSSNEEMNVNELEDIKTDPNRRLQVKLAFNILWNLKYTPHVDKKNHEINAELLNNYIEELQSLGEKYYRVASVNRVIGKLLGNYPECDNYPPHAICDIIERLDNKDVNTNFSCQVHNKGGLIGKALTGGRDNSKSIKYKKYADITRFSYPVIANIFDELSQGYADRAIIDDNRTRIESMEY